MVLTAATHEETLSNEVPEDALEHLPKSKVRDPDQLTAKFIGSSPLRYRSHMVT
jgi:hypothetical protein